MDIWYAHIREEKLFGNRISRYRKNNNNRESLTRIDEIQAVRILYRGNP